ncbi:MAG: hypothetical protein K6E18_04030 [Lachnospiraceae bacterium]|nr:hypothetical protein [Lachnospiraceae bacterium]
MDITVYFLKLEDKYWGLLLIAAVFLLAAAYKKKDRRLFAALGLYGLLSYLLFLCPLTYSAIGRFFVPQSRYELLSHIWAFSLLLPLAAALALGLARDKKQRIFAALMLVAVFFLAGDFFLIPEAAAQQTPGLYKSYEKTYDAILSDAAGRGQSPVIWGPAEWMAMSRIVGDGMLPVYGKDITAFPEKYPEQALSLKQGYDSYEDPESPLENKDDQIGALGNLLLQYPEMGCHYLALTDPKSQGLSYSAEEILAPLGYERVAKEGDLEVYVLAGN